MDRFSEAEGAKAGRKNERLCTREERKRRKTTAAGAEEGPHVQRPSDTASPISNVQDDRSSAASGLDVVDRLTYLEQRMQMQEDEIQLLKMALADVLKRLNITEEHQANAGAVRRPGVKARPVSLALSSRPAMKKSSTAPSAGPGRNYSPTPSSSSLRSPPGSVKDSPKARSGSAASIRKPQDTSAKPKDAAVTLGTRKVTHCKVTMQIYLSPLAKKTGCSEPAKPTVTVTTRTKPSTGTSTGTNTNTNTGTSKTTNRPRTKTESVKGGKKKEKFTLNLQKTTSQSAPQEKSYQSPVKSPSQYFQICY